MLPFLSLFSCALQTVDLPSTELDVDHDDLVGAHDVREAVSSSPDQVLVRLPRAVDGFVELRAYRHDKGEVVWTGRPMSTFELGGERADLTLPIEPPALDRVGAETPVTYAISLRLTDRRGNPGVYVGVAEARVVYMPVATEAGPPKGWSLAVDHADGGVVSFPLSTLVYFGENLVGADTLDLAGFTHLRAGADSRVAVLTGVDDAPATYDGALTREWGVSLVTPPVLASWEDEALGGTALSVYTYEDIDGDGVLTTEEVTGEACSPFGPAIVTWYRYPHDLRAALTLVDRGLHAGWGVGTLGEDGYAPLPRGMERSLVIDAACR
jgi:hypothetical protein